MYQKMAGTGLCQAPLRVVHRRMSGAWHRLCRGWKGLHCLTHGVGRPQGYESCVEGLCVSHYFRPSLLSQEEGWEESGEELDDIFLGDAELWR